MVNRAPSPPQRLNGDFEIWRILWEIWVQAQRVQECGSCSIDPVDFAAALTSYSVLDNERPTSVEEKAQGLLAENS